MMVSRTLYSVRNVLAIWLGQVVSLLCTFVVRIVFVRFLAQDYLGLETLFSNVLSMLTLAELGVGSAIVFSLYKPLADGDKEAVKSIMRLFRHAYVAIGVAIALIGCILAPNIDMLINGAPDIPGLKFYFLFFVFNTSFSYFFSYKGILITADQKNYIVALIRYAFQIGQCVLQIAVLVVTQDYVLFLLCMLAATAGQNLLTVYMANRLYPYLKERDIAPIDQDVLGSIKQNVVGMVFHKVSSVVNAPVNTVVISSVLGLTPVAIYGNYLLITNSLSKFVDQMFNAVVSSIGNLRVASSDERQYEVFKTAHFVNAVLYGMLTVCLLPLVAPFVQMAFGENYLYPMHVAVLFAIWFYFRGMRDAVLTFISAYGLYWQTRFKALAESVALVASVALLTWFVGIEGLMLANIAVQIFISTFLEASVLFKYGLRKSPRTYFRRSLLYAAVTACLTAFSCFVVSLLPNDPLLRFLLGGVVSVIIGLGGFSLVFCRTREFCEVKDITVSLVKSRMGKR